MLTDNLRKYRKARNLTQDQVAEYLNVQRTTYTRYETGTNKPDYETLCKLAEYFRVSLDQLLDRELPTPDVFPVLSPEEQELLRLYQKANQQAKDVAFFALKSGISNK